MRVYAPLLVAALSSVACATSSLPVPEMPEVIVERCPEMTSEAILNWAELWPKLGVDLKVWMGKTIVYCEDINEMLD